MYVAEGPSIRPQRCLKREAEGSAAVAAAGSDAGCLGNVVPLLLFVFLLNSDIVSLQRFVIQL